MRRTAALFILFALIGISAIPSAAQVGPRITPIFITASTNDDAASAQGVNPDSQYVVTNVETATTEGSESSHTCGAPVGPGGNSVWFHMYLAPGTLTLDTGGSSYTTTLGPSTDTVISLYRLTNFAFITFADLTPVACNDNGAGAGIINAFNIVTLAEYYVQVSAAPILSVSGASQVVMTATYTAAAPVPNDEPEGAKKLKIPSMPAVINWSSATRNFDEPVDPDLTMPLTNTIWFKFTFTSARIFSVQGFYGSGENLWFSVFEKIGNAYVAVSAITLPDLDSLSAFLDAGTYYLRVGIANRPEGTGAAFITFTSVTYLAPHNYSFAVGETEGALGAAPSLDGWTLKNGEAGPTGDGAFCDGGPDFACYFQLSSAGAGEATTLQSKVKLSDVKFKKGDIVVLQPTLIDLVGTPNFTLTLTVTDAAGASQSFPLTVGAGNSGNAALVTMIPKTISPVKAVIKLKNKDLVPGDRVEIDSLIVAALRAGEGVVRGGSLKLPLGGEIPMQWATTSSAGPKGVLAAPPPAQ